MGTFLPQSNPLILLSCNCWAISTKSFTIQVQALPFHPLIWLVQPQMSSKSGVTVERLLSSKARQGQRGFYINGAILSPPEARLSLLCAFWHLCRAFKLYYRLDVFGFCYT